MNNREPDVTDRIALAMSQDKKPWPTMYGKSLVSDSVIKQVPTSLHRLHNLLLAIDRERDAAVGENRERVEREYYAVRGVLNVLLTLYAFDTADGPVQVTITEDGCVVNEADEHSATSEVIDAMQGP